MKRVGIFLGCLMLLAIFCVSACAETIGEVVEPCPYLSENGFSLCYDAAFLKPLDEDDMDVFKSVVVDDATVVVTVAYDVDPESYESFLMEAVGDNDAQYDSILTDTDVIMRATVQDAYNGTFYYLVPFKTDVLAFTCIAPLETCGEWGARFDLMAESVTF